jgi:hypothetical protein
VAIAVKVPHCYGQKSASHGIHGHLRGGLKAAIALPHQNGDGVGAKIRRGQVQVAIVVKVSYGRGSGAKAHQKILTGEEGH